MNSIKSDCPVCTTPSPEALIVKSKETSLTTQQTTISLKISVLSRSTLSQVAIQPIQTAISQWKTLCAEELKRTEKDDCPEKKRFQDAWGMCSIISESLSSKDFDPTERVLLCTESKSSKIQGVALICDTENFLLLNDIVTNPENIQVSLATSTTGKVRGAGTAIIAECARQCLLEEKGGIFLKALKGAQEFYKNCGFEILDASDDCLPSMFLSSSTLQPSDGSTPRLLQAGTSLTPQIDRPQSSLSKQAPVTSKGERSSKLSFTGTLSPEKIFSKTNEFSVRVFPQSTMVYTTRTTSSFLNKTIQKICSIVSRWELKCHQDLASSKTKTKRQKLLLPLTARCEEGVLRLKKFDPSNDIVFAFCDKKRSTLQGVVIFSTKKNMFTLEEFIIKPGTSLSPNIVTYPQMIARFRNSLLPLIKETCHKAGKEGVFVRAMVEEEKFFKKIGFENVDPEGRHLGRVRMLFSAKPLLTEEKQ